MDTGCFSRALAKVAEALDLLPNIIYTRGRQETGRGRERRQRGREGGVLLSAKDRCEVGSGARVRVRCKAEMQIDQQACGVQSSDLAEAIKAIWTGKDLQGLNCDLSSIVRSGGTIKETQRGLRTQLRGEQHLRNSMRTEFELPAPMKTAGHCHVQP